MTPNSELVQVDLVALVEDQDNSSPIVLLHDRAGNRLLPIWIGDAEARSIAIALNRTPMPRPLTHKLLANTIVQMGGRLISIIVNKMEGRTYFAGLNIQIGIKKMQIDSRPSDAIALALEARCPIFVTKAIMDKAAQKNPLPTFAAQQAKRPMGVKDLEKLKGLLEKAREREQKSTEL